MEGRRERKRESALVFEVKREEKVEIIKSIESFSKAISSIDTVRSNEG